MPTLRMRRVSVCGMPGRQAQASLYAFDLVDRRARTAPGRPAAEPRPIRKVGLVAPA